MCRLLFFILTFLFLALPADLLAQRKKETNKVTPEMAMDKEKTAREAKNAEYKGRKDHHKKIQDKATRKRMKKNLRKAEKHSWGKDVPWYKRWFRKDKF